MLTLVRAWRVFLLNGVWCGMSLQFSVVSCFFHTWRKAFWCIQPYIFLSFSGISNLNFLINTAWYRKRVPPFIYSSCRRPLLPWNSSRTSLYIPPSNFFFFNITRLISTLCVSSSRTDSILYFHNCIYPQCFALAVKRSVTLKVLFPRPATSASLGDLLEL